MPENYNIFKCFATLLKELGAPPEGHGPLAGKHLIRPLESNAWLVVNATPHPQQHLHVRKTNSVEKFTPPNQILTKVTGMYGKARVYYFSNRAIELLSSVYCKKMQQAVLCNSLPYRALSQKNSRLANNWVQGAGCTQRYINWRKRSWQGSKWKNCERAPKQVLVSLRVRDQRY